MRIERLLDRQHDLGGSSRLFSQQVLFAHADAVLASTGPTHRDGPFAHPPVQGLDAFQFSRNFRVEKEKSVEITVTHVSRNRAENAGRVDVFASCCDTICQARYRNADIGDQKLLGRL